jgi:hypothetical protein
MWLWVWLFVFVALLAGYFAFLRPILKQWKALADFWATELNFFQKLQLFFEGLKIKLLARLLWVPGLLVMAYDKFTTLCAACDLSPVTAQLPDWVQHALPIVSALVIPMLIDIARSYSSAPAEN